MNSRFPKNRIFLSIHKTLAAVLLVLLVFSDISRLPYFGEWLAQFSAFTIEKALAIAGDFSIYREQTGGEVVASTTVPLSVTWDTVVSENANITLQSGSSTVDLVEAGKYLVLYNVWTDEGAGGDERRNFETYLTLNGSEIPYGRGYGYLRDSGGDNDAYAAGIGIIEAGAGDDLEVVINRDDTNDETAGIRSGTNVVSVLILKDDFDYLRIKKNTNTSGIQTATTFTDVIWDTTDEADTGSFGFTNGSGDITLKGAEGEHFLVSAGVGILQTYGDSTRQNYELRLTLDGAEIPGTRVTAYPRGNSNSDGIFQVSLIYSGIIQKTAAGDQTLNIEYRRESQSSSQSQITGADTSLAIVALPNTAHYISLTSTTSAQSYTSTPSAFTWNEQLEVDTTAFSHSTTTNNSRINIDLEGDYLFLSTAYATRTSGTARNVPVIDWRLDGTTGIQYGGHGSFNRGDQSTADAYTSGSSGGLIVPGLSDTQYIEVMVRDEALASPNAVFNPHHIAVQGVELSLLFQTNVDVAATGTHVATTSVPATDVYQGGSFVITENTGSRFISSIDLTESGAIDGSTGLENIKILYDLDTSDPYDCASESYGGGESQYGSTDANGFSGPDGVSSFSGSVTISTTQAFCGYVIYDVTDAATDGDTIEITIDNPSTDVAVTSGGTVSPAIPVGPSASTTVVSAELTQTHYRWLQDDGIEGAATAVEAEDTAAGGFANGAINRLRTQVYAAGSVSSAATTLQLDYATKTASCAAVSQWIDVGAVGGAWDMSNSTFIVDGTDATNIGAGSGGV
ncbi:hypothetical protein KC906_02705, partial [Candidatus Kaiserbacteria bacterium]|nr:hypothetical protein [Candidatus Kaiserbacteria bacterium]